MFELVERVDEQTGEIERVPLPFLYALGACEVFYYGREHRVETAPGSPEWYRIWRPSVPVAVPKRERLYEPHIMARTNGLVIASARSILAIFFAPRPIYCTMRGQPFLESDLESLYRAWAHLPRSTEVREAMIAKADWLDANPGFRDIPVKQSPTTARTMSNDDWRNNDATE